MHGIILTQGSPDRCVRAYPLDGFEQQAALYMHDPVTTQTGRVMRRAFFSAAYDAQLDRQSRVLIPPQLRQWAGLEGQVSVVGAGDAIEIWNAGDLDRVLQQEEAEFRQSMGSA